MNGQHSSLPPSGAPIWGRCAAAVHAFALAANLDTRESIEGTAAHWVCSECLTTGEIAANYLGQKDPAGTIVDDKMVEGAQVYLDDCRAQMQLFPSCMVAIEQRVGAPNLVHPDNWGTTDFALVDMQSETIIVSDYKHGHGKVDAKGNLQLANYCAGIVETIGIRPEFWHEWAVVFRVVQPFCFQRSAPVDVWQGNLTELVPLWDQLKAKAYEGKTACPMATPGAHCRYCPGRIECGSADQFTSHIIDESSRQVDLSTVESHELATMLDIMKSGETVLKSRLDAISDELKHRIGEGDMSSGKALHSVQGNRGYWNAPDKVIIALGTQFKVDLRSDKALTPAQSRGKIPADKKELWEKATAGLSYKKSSIQLIDASETTAARVFGKK